MSDFSTRWGGGRSTFDWDSHHWDEKWKKKELEETDWWRRRKERKTYSSRLGFGSDDHKSYYSSSYGFSTSTRSYYTAEFGADKAKKVEILQKAYANSRDLVNILPFPYRLNIYYDANGYSRNQHNHDKNSLETNIFVSLDCMKNIRENINLEEEERIIRIFTGNSLHEASHLLNTEIQSTERFFGSSRALGEKLVIPVDTTFMTKFLVSCFGEEKLTVGKYLEDSGKDNTLRSSKAIIYSLFNAIEGERVDSTMLEERQGWGEFFEEYKNYLYSKVYSYRKYYSTKSTKIDFLEFYYILIKSIRFPDKISEEMLKKYAYPLEKSRKWLESKSTMDSCMNAFSLFKFILLPILKHQGEEINEDFSKNLEETPEELLKDSSTDDLTLDIPLKSLAPTLKNMQVFYGKDKLKTGLSLTDIDIIRHSIYKDESGGKESVIDESYLDVITNEIDGNFQDKVFFYKPAGDSIDYEKDKLVVSPYIPALRNLVRNVNKNYEFTIHGQRNGKLDTDKLAEAYQGISHVYVRKGRVNTSGMTVCVVIDESGSMCGQREKLARQAAVLLNEAFGKIPGIDMYIYGHTADITSSGSTEINTYREPGMTYVAGKAGVGLSKSCARRENRDGKAILEIAKRVRKFTKNPVMMFILSDGNPSAEGYRGNSAVRDTAEKVLKVESMGFFPIQINICSSCCDSAEMFKNYIDMTSNLNELPKTLGVAVRNELVKLMSASQTVTQI